MADSILELVPEIEDLADRLRDGGTPKRDEAELVVWALGVAARVTRAAYDDADPTDGPDQFMVTKFVQNTRSDTIESFRKIITMTPPRSKKRGREH